MPSEDAKTAATATQSVKEEDEDRLSLGSILKDRKNKALNANLGSSPKPRPKVVKVQGEEAGGSNDGSDKKKPLRSGLVSVSGPGSRVVKVKKEEKAEEDDDDDKPISRKLASVKLDKEVNVKKKVKQENIKTVKVEVKRKKSPGGSKEETPQKREKKVYDLPGQKRDPPEERDPLRIFYESLHKQIPRSEMAQFWMMESGLLPKEEAKKAFDKKQRKSHAQKLSSPAKSAVSVQRSSQTVSIKKKDLSSSVSSKKKTMDVKVLSKQPKKRKDEDRNSGEDSDDDFVISRAKKPRTAN